jgi:hypothetical protein
MRRKKLNEFGLTDEEIEDIFPLRNSPAPKEQSAKTPSTTRISAVKCKPYTLGHFGTHQQTKSITASQEEEAEATATTTLAN